MKRVTIPRTISQQQQQQLKQLDMNKKWRKTNTKTMNRDISLRGTKLLIAETPRKDKTEEETARINESEQTLACIKFWVLTHTSQRWIESEHTNTH